MTAPRKVALMGDEIREAAKKYAVEWLPSNTVGGTFEAGARFARDFYEQREALWRELEEINGALCDHGQDCTDCDAMKQAALVARLRELRAALGLEEDA